jgi:thiosulfate/3-mercaptopyruvate sulfurtransferase
MLRGFPWRTHPARVCGMVASLLFSLAGCGSLAASREPWTEAQLISPEALHQRLAGTKMARPLILQVGFRTLYDQGHIPGSQYHGPASKPEGLAELEKYLQHLPRRREIIIYCGCCPWHDCPNIRPAFQALNSLGFTRVKVLSIPSTFLVDWANAGYPIEKSQ